ncbi:sulfatase-like hydrolase/transferase [Polaribacter sejongensis]|uniref:sulfatase-like hydrolase/transferase n=1 Tax=Polaribacter sejongensis TaxID=985043 RepID=UPI0035A59CCD
MNKSLKFLSLALLVFTVISCGSKSSTEKSSSEEVETSLRKPNIIYILADDLGYGDLGSYGQTMFKTPNIDKLVTEGLMFTQHYAGNTVCAPSRSALLTGQHTWHTPLEETKKLCQKGNTQFLRIHLL